jgi:hypothetical protein
MRETIFGAIYFADGETNLPVAIRRQAPVQVAVGKTVNQISGNAGAPAW